MKDDLREVLADLDRRLVQASRRADAKKDPELWAMLDLIRVRLQRVGLLLFLQDNLFSNEEREVKKVVELDYRP